MNKRLYDYIIKNNGATLEYNKALNMFFKRHFINGYSVAIQKEQTIYTRNYLENIKAYAKNLKSNCLVGFWVDNGKMYIDIVKVYKTKAYALKIARQNDQLAIWDFEKGQAINL